MGGGGGGGLVFPFCIYHFDRTGTPFACLSLKKVPLSHTASKHCIHFLNLQCYLMLGMKLMNNITEEHGYFQVMLNQLNDTAIRCVCSNVIKGPFKYLNDRFPNPFIYLNLGNPYLFYT